MNDLRIEARRDGIQSYGEFSISCDDLVRMPMAFKLNNLTLPTGRYRWQFVIDGLGDTSWGCDFLVSDTPVVQMLPASPAAA